MADWMDGRWATITKVSEDKGPYKLVTVEAEGHEIDVIILEGYGVQGSPIKDGQVYILPTNRDNGQAVGVMMPPPAKRRDGQKEGEASYINHATGNRMKHDANGNTLIDTAGICYINCDPGGMAL